MSYYIFNYEEYIFLSIYVVYKTSRQNHSLSNSENINFYPVDNISTYSLRYKTS